MIIGFRNLEPTGGDGFETLDPILVTLDRVGPDVHELLDVLQDVRHAIQGVPGFTMFRRRGEEKEREAVEDARG